MSKQHENGEHGNGDTRRLKMAIGGAVIEWCRKWGVTALVGWLAVQQGLVPVPGLEPKKPSVASDTLPRAAFDAYRTEHEKWGYSMIDRIDGNVAKLDVKMDRVIERLDRALLAVAPASITNVIARRP